jgi:hypothetical protein
MKKSLLFTAFMAGSFVTTAQIERAAFTETGRGAASAFVTDYHALGINPANLAYGNEYNKKYTLGIGQFTFSNFAEGLTRSQLSDAITGVNETLTVEEQFQAAESFRNKVLSVDATVLWFGYAVNTEKAGNFAFSVGARFNHFSRFNETASDHIWRGFVDPYFDQWVVTDQGGLTDTIANQGPGATNIDDVSLGLASNPERATALYDGTLMRSLAYMEYNLGYGRTVFENDELKLNAGVGLKFLQGMYVLNVEVEENNLVSAYTASSPGLNIDYGSGAQNNPSAVDGAGFVPVGNGFGFDLGLGLEVSDQFRLAASITDIGSINFDGNVYQTADTTVYDFATLGMESYNLFEEFDVFAGDDGLFQWEGKESQKVKLPTQLRFGMAYFHNEKFRFGLDVALPLNDEPGNIQQMSFAGGVDYIPTPAVRISAGVGAGDNFDFRVPFGLNFMVAEGTFEFGIASRDILYFLRDDRPNLSIAMGFLRFRFGDIDKGNQSRMFG